MLEKAVVWPLFRIFAKSVPIFEPLFDFVVPGSVARPVRPVRGCHPTVFGSQLLLLQGFGYGTFHSRDVKD